VICVALQNALSGLANVNRVSAKNHVTPEHCALSNRVLFRALGVNFGKCKKHSHASCKSALSALPTRLHPMKSECIAPWFTDLFGITKNRRRCRGKRKTEGGDGTPHKVSDDTLLLATVLTPLLMDYTRLTGSVK